MTTDLILPACSVALGDPRVWSNAASIDAGFARALHWCNAARHVAMPAVTLERYDSDTIMQGGSPFALLSGGALVVEDFFVAPGDQAAVAAGLAAQAGTALAIDRPCLLACHGSFLTWGHWLLDTLPKIVLAERARPMLFTYVIPGELFSDPGRAGYAAAVLESLAAYGITPPRCFPARPGQFYRFAALFDVRGAVARPVHPSLRQMHPGAVAALRDVALSEAAPAGGLVALLRGAATARSMANRDRIVGIIQEAGGHLADPAAGFAAQVAAVRGADILVADLGSNMAALAFARPGTRLVTLAPCFWRDSYFVNVAQLCGAIQADVRGISLPDGGGPAKDFYHVDPAALRDALAAVAAPVPAGPRRVAGWPTGPATGAAYLTLDFGAGGNAAPYLSEGFAAPERLHTWSLGARCRIDVPDGIVPDGDFWLEIAGGGFTASGLLPAAVLAVSVNGVLLERLVVDGLAQVSIFVPGAVAAQASGLCFEFETPLSAAPLSLGVSGDGRPLGFAFRRVAVRRVA